MGSDSESEPDEAANDLELNRKVATVMAPIMKKLRKQAKRIEVLEEQLAKQQNETSEKFPRIDERVGELVRTVDEGFERTRRDIGERVVHADHARVEVTLSSELSSQKRLLDEVRTRLAQQELLTKTMQARVDEVDSGARRATDAVEERLAHLRTTVNDEVVRADARRAELQLHVAEISAKLSAELIEAKRTLEAEQHKLASGLAATAKRSETLERFGQVEEAIGHSTNKADRHDTKLLAFEESMAELQGEVRQRARSADVARLRTDVEHLSGSAATSDALATVVREAANRENEWQRRQLSVEHSASASMREVRQMAANLEVLSSRLAEHALAAELDELKDQFGALSHDKSEAQKDAVQKLSDAHREAASKDAVEVLRGELDQQAVALQALIDGTNARLERKADAEVGRRVEAELKRLAKAVEEKVGVGNAERMLEHKADAEALKKLSAAAQRDAAELSSLLSRVEAAEGALHSAKRDSADAIEHARTSAAALSQLQSASDKHWQITRSSREEQAQLVKAVRALLLDAELRVTTDQQNAASPATRLDGFADVYGQHGWDSPSARLRQQNSLPRVAAAVSSGGSAAAAGGGAAGGGSGFVPVPPNGCASPKRSGAGSFVTAASPLTNDGDVLSRRRRLLAGLGGAGGSEGGVALPDNFALPSTRTRTSTEPYSQGGLLVPISSSAR